MNCKKRYKLFSSFLILVIFWINIGIAFGYEKEIKNLSASIAERVAKAGKKNIAVVDFTDLQGNVTELGRFIAEEFSVELAGADKGFEVVERTQLKSILKEHKLAVSDLIDPSTARKLGQIAGVDALITGTITPFGESIRLSVKILDTTTAKIIGATSGDIPKTKAIEELLARSIDTGPTPEGTAPASRSKTKVVAKIEMNDSSFEVRECTRSGQNVSCLIAVTNTAKIEKQLSLYFGNTFLYDNVGFQYKPSELKYGATTSGWAYSDYSIAQLLPPLLPIIAVFTFKDISPQAEVVSLRVNCSNSQVGNFAVVLRNIPLTKM